MNKQAADFLLGKYVANDANELHDGDGGRRRQEVGEKMKQPLFTTEMRFNKTHDLAPTEIE